MKTIRIAVPFVGEIQPLLDNLELQYQEVRAIEFQYLPGQVQNFILNEISDNLDMYYEAVCKTFVEYMKGCFLFHVPSSELVYVNFDEYDVWADFSFGEQKLRGVLNLKEGDLLDADLIYEGMQKVIESQRETKWRVEDLRDEVQKQVSIEEYVDLSCFAELAEQTFELSRHADWEFEEYKRQMKGKLTGERLAEIREEQLKRIDANINEYISVFEDKQ